MNVEAVVTKEFKEIKVCALVIVPLEDGWFFVSYGDRFNERMAFEEVLGLVACVMMPERRPCSTWLKTAEELRRFEEHMAVQRKVFDEGICVGADEAEAT